MRKQRWKQGHAVSDGPLDCIYMLPWVYQQDAYSLVPWVSRGETAKPPAQKKHNGLPLEGSVDVNPAPLVGVGKVLVLLGRIVEPHRAGTTF